MSEELFELAKSSFSKKIETLGLIKSKILYGLVDETILDNLEAMEELDGALGESAPESIIPAYRAVALECTAAILVGGGGEPGPKYTNAVDRIWRRRIGRLEERGGDCKLVTGELKKCREKIELSFHDLAVCTELCGSNTRNEALLLVQAYLKEEEERSVPDSVKHFVTELDNGVDISPKPQPSLNEKIVIPENIEPLSETPSKKEEEEEEAQQNVRKTVVEKVVQTSNLDNGVDISPKPQSSPDFLQGDEKIVIPENIEFPKETASKNAQNPVVKKAVQTSNCEDDADVSAEPKTGNRRRINTPKPKRKSNNELILARRKNKRWTPHEEEVLRNDVRRFGNSWKFILTLHSCEFEGRTEVDLKDKWRNMNRYSTNP